MGPHPIFESDFDCLTELGKRSACNVKMRFVNVILKIWLGFVTKLNAEKPNVLIIIADDLGWHDIGLHNELFQTPNIDKLITDSIKLDNYYVNPICTPTRSVLLSGRYQIHTGLQHGVILEGQRIGFPLSDILLPEALRDCGYRNHLVGKWHLGMYRNEMLPENRGFESHFGYLGGAEGHYSRTQCMKGLCGMDFRDDGCNRNVSDTLYSSDLYTDRIENIVAEHDTKDPLFLYAGLQNVHFPLEAPQEYLDYYSWIKDHDRRVFAAMTMALDHSVGRIINSFKAKGIWDNTIVYFTTDNGGSSWYGGNNFPLRGIKATLWEGGIKGIGSIRIPGVSAKQTRNQLMHVSDIMPTMLKLTSCPVAKKDQMKFDGNDQSEMLIHDKESPTEEFLINIDPLLVRPSKTDKRKWKSSFDVSTQAGLRWKEWKILTGDPGGPDGWIFPPELDQNKLHFKRKLSKYQDPTPLQSKNTKRVVLFNIETDPLETEDLSDKRPDIVEIMLDKLAAHNKTAIPPQPGIFDAAANPDFHGGFCQPWILTP